jgi:hypothetical protein
LHIWAYFFGPCKGAATSYPDSPSTFSLLYNYFTKPTPEQRFHFQQLQFERVPGDTSSLLRDCFLSRVWMEMAALLARQLEPEV